MKLMNKFLILIFLLNFSFVNLFSQEDESHFQVLTGYYNDVYNEPYTRMYNVFYGGFGYKSENFTLYGKVNYNVIAKSFDNVPLAPSTNGRQYELDYYQRLTKSTTSWWNYAYSNDTGFPDHRFMMRVWQELPKAFLISGGLSYYIFDNQSVFFSNYGVEKYIGNFWLEYKFYTFFKEPKIKYAHHLTSRIFIKDVNFIQTRISMGYAEDEPWNIEDYLGDQPSYNLGLQYVTMIGERYQLRTGILYTYEKYNENDWRNRYSASIGLSFNLN